MIFIFGDDLFCMYDKIIKIWSAIVQSTIICDLFFNYNPNYFKQWILLEF